MERKILIGADVENPLYDLRDSEIRLGISGVVTSSLLGDELAIDQLRFRVNAKNVFRSVYETTGGGILADPAQVVYVLNQTPESALDALENLPYATPVWYYKDGELSGKFYLDTVEQVTKTDFYLNCVSAVGILDKQKHLGGIYTGQTLTAVLTEIIGGAFPFTVSSAAAQIKIYNWLPIESKREAIHQIVYAHGVNVLKRADGELYFDFLQQTTALALPDERIFLGGSAKHTPPATRVEVIEHSFFKLSTDSDVVLFDNTDGAAPAGNSFVAFREAPVYGLSASSGLVIHASGVNYAVVSGVGILTGKRYNHQTNRVGRDSSSAAGMEKIVDGGSACTLVSVLNSSNVTRRLLSYHSSAQTINADIIVDGEKPGDQLKFNNPFGRAVTAFLASMEYNVTSFERARCELVTNYEPTPPGGGDYTHVEVITASGTWTVPSGVTEFTAVLIGGGSGGSGGNDGEAGKNGSNATASAGNTSTSNGGAGGNGGAAGAAGIGGRIFQVRLEAPSGTVFTASIGAGGKGGARNGGAGSAGGNTTFSGNGGNYTSANGAISPSGYFDVMGQKAYGASGTAGNSGANGGPGRSGTSTLAGSSGESAGTYRGGAGSTRTTASQSGTSYAKPDFTEYTQETTSVSANDTVTGAYDSKTNVAQDKQLEPSRVYYHSFCNVNPETGEWYWDSDYYDRFLTEKTIVASKDSISGSRYYYTVVAIIEGKNLRLASYGSNSYIDYGDIYWRDDVVYTTVESSGYGWTKYFSGCGGGGAAISANGSNATTNSGAPGVGGKGANATKPAAPTVPGTGGGGGNGGGGGGGGGGARVIAQENASSITASGGSGGSGGQGSAGGDGAPGCVLIYY